MYHQVAESNSEVNPASRLGVCVLIARRQGCRYKPCVAPSSVYCFLQQQIEGTRYDKGSIVKSQFSCTRLIQGGGGLVSGPQIDKV